jgi:nucleoid-associated protein YgaU
MPLADARKLSSAPPITPSEEASMSLIDFVKDAGKKVGMGEQQPNAQQLKSELDAQKIGADQISVDVQGDKAVLSGVAPNHDVLERAVVSMGNVVGISKVEANVKVPATETSARASTMYTVKNGDTLSDIAEHVYGKGKSGQFKTILAANQPMLSSADKIYPGQVLRIPPTGLKMAS